MKKFYFSVAMIGLTMILSACFHGSPRPANTPSANTPSDKTMQKGEDMMEALKYSLTAQNNSGQTGSVTFSDAGAGKTKVMIETVGAPQDVPQPAHIHTGSCHTLGGVKYPLTNVVNGKSETVLAIAFAELWHEVPFAVNIHKSAAEAGIYVACSDVTPDQGMKENDGGMPDKDAMMKKNDGMVKFSGPVLAGNTSPVVDFNQSDYAAALKSDKVVLLYFYANWCPICKAEIPKLYYAFNALTNDQVVGFRVNFNDSDTDAAEQALAREFGVAYQHTKVILKNGQRLLKSPESWDQARYANELAAAINK